MKNIFRLIDNRTNDTIFIGYTTMPLSSKLAGMKINWKYNRGCDNYKSIFKDIGLEHISIELVEVYEYDSFDELKKKENDLKRVYKLSVFSCSQSSTSERTANSETSSGIPSNYHLDNSSIIEPPILENFKLKRTVLPNRTPTKTSYFDKQASSTVLHQLKDMFNHYPN